MLVKCTDAVYPFLMPHGQYVRKFAVGVDFTSGDDIVIKFTASDKIKFWIATSADGSVITGTEAAIGGGITGQKLTFAGITADLHVFAIIDV